MVWWGPIWLKGRHDLVHKADEAHRAEVQLQHRGQDGPARTVQAIAFPGKTSSRSMHPPCSGRGWGRGRNDWPMAANHLHLEGEGLDDDRQEATGTPSP